MTLRENAIGIWNQQLGEQKLLNYSSA